MGLAFGVLPLNCPSGYTAHAPPGQVRAAWGAPLCAVRPCVWSLGFATRCIPPCLGAPSACGWFRHNHTMALSPSLTHFGTTCCGGRGILGHKPQLPNATPQVTNFAFGISHKAAPATDSTNTGHRRISGNFFDCNSQKKTQISRQVRLSRSGAACTAANGRPSQVG